jgi:hypothetical protein
MQHMKTALKLMLEIQQRHSPKAQEEEGEDENR